jgi:trimeric autotransporter adhesin
MRKFYFLNSLLLLFTAGYSQFNYQATNASVVSGTYTDLGTSGTVISNSVIFGGAISYDDDISTTQNIGFNFTYNGTVYTQFKLSTNGFISLGTTTPSEINFNYLNDVDQNIIAPFNLDLIGNVAPEYRVFTSGSVGSRICTIQFEDLKDLDFGSGQYSSINFQIKLYETTNNVDFVYGTFTSLGTTPAVLEASVGLMGSSPTFSVNATKASTAAWTAAAFINGGYTGNHFNSRNSVLPTSGFTLRFVAEAIPNNDAQVTDVYTLGQLPFNYGFPHNVRAVIKNGGQLTLTNLLVTMNVSGANSFTSDTMILSLAPGASTEVTFDPFTATQVGDNIVTVTVPADDENTNNSGTYDMSVSTGLFSYANSDEVAGKSGFGIGEGLILTKYRMTGTANVTGVRIHISNDVPSIGDTVYAVLLNSFGTILSRSADLIIANDDLDKYKSFTLTSPASITNADFYVGLAQKASLVPYYPLSYQNEGTPARSGAYYSASINGGGISQSTSVGRFMIQALINGVSVPDTADPVNLCAPGNTMLVASESGTTYQWKLNTGSGFNNISNNANYSGVTNDTLTLINIPTSFYGYQYACFVDGNMGAITSLKFTNYWIGTISNAWETAGNWSCNSVPDANTDVYINSGTPVINSVANCRAIFVNSGASLTITSGKRLNVTR